MKDGLLPYLRLEKEGFTVTMILPTPLLELIETIWRSLSQVSRSARRILTKLG
jgi:hypothetical protein